MVPSIRRRQNASMKTIESILKKAEVPSTWYSVERPFECRLSVTDEVDGIHVFIPERGKRVGENIHHTWFDAIKDIADYVGPSYKPIIMKLASEIERQKKIPAVSTSAVASTHSTYRANPSLFIYHIKGKTYKVVEKQDIRIEVDDKPFEEIACVDAKVLAIKNQERVSKQNSFIRTRVMKKSSF